MKKIPLLENVLKEEKFETWAELSAEIGLDADQDLDLQSKVNAAFETEDPQTTLIDSIQNSDKYSDDQKAKIIGYYTEYPLELSEEEETEEEMLKKEEEEIKKEEEKLEERKNRFKRTRK